MPKNSRSIKEILPEVECICPNCKCKHMLKMKWIGGKITPRKYCEPCKSRVKTFSHRVDLTDTYQINESKKAMI